MERLTKILEVKLPGRTKEELEEIYKDLLEIRKVANKLHKRGYFIYNPFKSGSASEQKKAFYQEFVKAYQNLIVDGKVTSCEGVMDVQSAVNQWNTIRESGYNIFQSPIKERSSRQMTTDNGVVLDELIAMVSRTIRGTAEPKIIQLVNDSLDTLGNCNIAFNEKLLNEARLLAFDPKKITINCLDNAASHGLTRV